MAETQLQTKKTKEMKLITDQLYTSWEDAPEGMDSYKTVEKLLTDIGRNLPPSTPEDNLQLFIDAPNLLSAQINYNIKHNAEVELAGYIELAKSAFRKDFREAKKKLGSLEKKASKEFLDYKLEILGDKTTWKSTNPALLQKLANQIPKTYTPEMIVAPAHGAIRPGILLSVLMGIDAYFIRFSRLKHKDEQPRVGKHDLRFLEQLKDKRILCYEEDVASGKSLKQFKEFLERYSGELKTATTLKFVMSTIQPDFFAMWYY